MLLPLIQTSWWCNHASDSSCALCYSCHSSSGLIGSNRHPWVIAWLVPAWSVDWSCVLGGLAVPVMSWRVGHWRGSCGDDESDWDSSRYQGHCSLRLWFSCLAWKPCMVALFGLGTGGGGWLHCSCDWSADGLGRLLRGFLWKLWNPLVSSTV